MTRKIPYEVPGDFRLVYQRRVRDGADAGPIEIPVVDDKIICFKTRKAFVPPQTPEQRKAATTAIVNDMLVEELSMLLQRAQSGELASLSYIALDRISDRFEWSAVMAIDTEDSAQHAIRHLGALEMLKDTLTDLAYEQDMDDDGSEWDDGEYED